jgi:hypothetical protein
MFGSRIAENHPARAQTYVTHLLERLAHLETKTRPSQGEATAKDKDMHVQEALRLAGQLVLTVAGWAIDHQIGLAFRKLENLPQQIDGLSPRAKRDYTARKAEVDQHGHERVGTSIDVDQDDPLFARRCLKFLLQHNQAGLPDWLSEMTLSGLRALDYGDDAPPMFERNTADRKLPEQVRRYQLRALAFIEYRKAALGVTKTVSEGDVAEAFGVSIETIKDWRKDLPKVLGAYEVDSQLAEARNRGSAYKIQKAKSSRGELEIQIRQLIADANYGDTALWGLANQYRAASNKRPLKKIGGRAPALPILRGAD